ncbi:hypothetical protein T265_09494 [Opisthorchis viverrini]|uniref:Uncharacterized protein n=1 Tax=Opisthorchis viverrini TaxID=6198 RepID=A0A074ZGP3_OPIVI|nr:hypothetical protein T265_09494 [Opisthorchis viverrini]KER22415.1 hypothetical protein T265_09494 [Opisthorchis viverrini]
MCTVSATMTMYGANKIQHKHFVTDIKLRTVQSTFADCAALHRLRWQPTYRPASARPMEFGGSRPGEAANESRLGKWIEWKFHSRLSVQSHARIQ